MKTMKGFPGRLAESIKTIARIDSTPEKIAGSIALGTFVGSFPITGLQNLTTIFLSVMLRLNKVGSVLSLEMYSNPLTLPFICYVDLRIGYFLLGRQPGLLRWADFKSLNWKIISETAGTLFTGSLFVGIVISSVAYLIAFKLITVGIRKKKLHDESIF